MGRARSRKPTEDAHIPSEPDPYGCQNADADRDATTGTPRWVKIFGVIALVVVVLIVVLLIIGGPHNPGRHALAAGSGASEHGEQAP
jgi:hypothetical protein